MCRVCDIEIGCVGEIDRVCEREITCVINILLLFEGVRESKGEKERES